MSLRYTRVSVGTDRAFAGAPAVVITGDGAGFGREFNRPTAHLGAVGTDGRVALRIHASGGGEALVARLAAAYVAARSAPLGGFELAEEGHTTPIEIHRDGEVVLLVTLLDVDPALAAAVSTIDFRGGGVDIVEAGGRCRVSAAVIAIGRGSLTA